MPTVHPQVAKAIKTMEDLKLQPVAAMSPAEARVQMEAMATSRKAVPLPVGRIEDRSIPGPGGPIPVRLYWPQKTGPVPVIAFYHGGGFVIGSLNSHDVTARNLCSGAEALVMAVDYRMGPEHKFPAAVDDSWAALKWLAANAASLGGDPQRLGVHGDSAGGNLATVVALMARDAGGPALKLQSLVYPLADQTLRGKSFDTYAEGYGLLTYKAALWFREHYLRNDADIADWRASPLHAKSLAGLPPAVVIVAECDILHDDCVAYAEALRRAGVPVEYHEFPGMIHAFFGMVPGIDDAMNAQRLVAAAFKRAFSA